MATDRCYVEEEKGAPGTQVFRFSWRGVRGSKETVLKTVGPYPGLVGSNPTPSADSALESRTDNVQMAADAAHGEVGRGSRRRSPAKRVGGVKPPSRVQILLSPLVGPVEWSGWVGRSERIA